MAHAFAPLSTKEDDLHYRDRLLAVDSGPPPGVDQLTISGPTARGRRSS